MVTCKVPLVFRQQAARALRARGLVPSDYLPCLDGPEEEGQALSLDELYLARRPLSERRRQGQYHTPEWLVDTLLTWLQWPNNHALLDPACGTGAFLLPAARRLADYCRSQGLEAKATLACVERSVIGYDVDPVALFILHVKLCCHMSDLLLMTGARPNWRLHRRDFLAEGPSDSGDRIIVGNPPWGAQVKQEVARRYQEPKESAFMFVEEILRHLVTGTPCALVLPDTILLKHYPRIRKMILTHGRICNLALLGRIFPDANVEAVALHLVGCQGSKNHHRIQIWQRKGRQALRALPRVEQEVFSDLPANRFNVVMSKQGARWIKRLYEGRICLRQVYHVHEGIHSGNVRHKLFLSVDPGEAGRRLLRRGKEVRPFQCRWAGEYVHYEPTLVHRQKGEYATLGRPHELGAPKVIVRRTGETLTAAFDEEGVFISNNFFYCLPQAGESLSPKVLVCLLNSTLMRHLYQLMNPVMGRMFAEVKIIHLGALPVPEPSGRRLQEVEPDLCGLHDVAKRGGLSPSVQGEIDELVLYLYDFSPRELGQLREHLQRAGMRYTKE